MKNISVYFFYNTSVVQLSKSPILHFKKKKYIDIRYHFLRDHISNGNIKVEFIDIINQFADIFTKPFGKDRFCFIRRSLE